MRHSSNLTPHDECKAVLLGITPSQKNCLLLQRIHSKDCNVWGSSVKRVKYFGTKLKRRDLNVSSCCCSDIAFGDSLSSELTETVLSSSTVPLRLTISG
jgi:hypothetical protein